MNTIELIERKLQYKDIQEISKVLFNSYNSFMLDSQVWELILAVLPNELSSDVGKLKGYMLGHNVINDLVVKYYPCESVIKYSFIKENLTNIDETIILEMNINNSRLDLGRVNGKSYAYEIKTELDNLDKLRKQIDDYSKVFEYVYALVHKKHFKCTSEIVPDFCGIVTFEHINENYKFKVKRKAKYSPNLDYLSQVKNLATKDLEFILRQQSIEVPNTRSEREEIIFRKLTASALNRCFKQAIKRKYQKRWEFLKSTFYEIQPIDIQAYFKNNVSPRIIYYKNSSIE